MRNKKISSDKFKQLDHFSFEFLNLLEEKNLKLLLKNLKEEMIADCCDIELIKSEIKDNLTLFEYLVNYTSKYCYFIYHFEKNQAYEYCADVRKCFKALASTYFNVDDELLEEMMLQSVAAFRKLNK